MKDRKSGDMEEWPKDLQRSSDRRIPGSISVGKVIKAEIAEPTFVCSYYKNTFPFTDRVVRAPFHRDTDLTFTIFNDQVLESIGHVDVFVAIWFNANLTWKSECFGSLFVH
jgi:hypothetical protein